MKMRFVVMMNFIMAMYLFSKSLYYKFIQRNSFLRCNHY